MSRPSTLKIAKALGGEVLLVGPLDASSVFRTRTYDDFPVTFIPGVHLPVVDDNSDDRRHIVVWSNKEGADVSSGNRLASSQSSSGDNNANNASNAAYVAHALQVYAGEGWALRNPRLGEANFVAYHRTHPSSQTCTLIGILSTHPTEYDPVMRTAETTMVQLLVADAYRFSGVARQMFHGWQALMIQRAPREIIHHRANKDVWLVTGLMADLDVTTGPSVPSGTNASITNNNNANANANVPAEATKPNININASSSSCVSNLNGNNDSNNNGNVNSNNNTNNGNANVNSGNNEDAAIANDAVTLFDLDDDFRRRAALPSPPPAHETGVGRFWNFCLNPQLAFWCSLGMTPIKSSRDVVQLAVAFSGDSAHPMLTRVECLDRQNANLAKQNNMSRGLPVPRLEASQIRALIELMDFQLNVYQPQTPDAQNPGKYIEYPEVRRAPHAQICYADRRFPMTYDAFPTEKTVHDPPTPTKRQIGTIETFHDLSKAKAAAAKAAAATAAATAAKAAAAATAAVGVTNGDLTNANVDLLSKQGTSGSPGHIQRGPNVNPNVNANAMGGHNGASGNCCASCCTSSVRMCLVRCPCPHGQLNASSQQPQNARLRNGSATSTTSTATTTTNDPTPLTDNGNVGKNPDNANLPRLSAPTTVRQPRCPPGCRPRVNPRSAAGTTSASVNGGGVDVILPNGPFILEQNNMEVREVDMIIVRNAQGHAHSGVQQTQGHLQRTTFAQ